jgi:hypothetical protein
MQTDQLRLLAEQYAIDASVLEDLLRQLERTQGRQAQFNHPALGGYGQWQSGMLMISAMNDHALKARVTRLFEDLLPLTRVPTTPPQPSPITPPPAPGSGASQGQQQSSQGGTGGGRSGFSGAQNGISYRYDSASNQLVINDTDTYDTTGYRLTGVSASQQNGGASSLVIHTDVGPKELRDFRKLR